MNLIQSLQIAWRNGIVKIIRLLHGSVTPQYQPFIYSLQIMTLQKKSGISWLIGNKPLDLPTITSCGLHFIVSNKDQVNLLKIFLFKSNQFEIKYLRPTLVRITCISIRYLWLYDLNMNLLEPLFYIGIPPFIKHCYSGDYF